MKKIICYFPLFIKKILMIIFSFFSRSKKEAINVLKKSFVTQDDFKELDNINVKKNFVKYIRQSILSGKELKNFIFWLYNDSISIIKKIDLIKDIPTIICVVKNESDKITKFIHHYKSIGKFNFVFIDNNSTDKTIDLLLEEDVMIYQVKEKFNTNRKLAWINKVFLNLPKKNWYLLLDVDEFLVYKDYENYNFNYFLESISIDNRSVGAVMIDMFANEQNEKSFLDSYVYFENIFNEKKSFYFNSIYGGIRQRSFNFGKKNLYLIKKHPLLYYENFALFCHCHYNYPYKLNFKSKVFVGLLHYKLFSKEIEKYKKIASDGTYAFGSEEYKNYVKVLSNSKYEEIFYISSDTIKYSGTKSLEEIKVLKDWRS